MFLDRLEEHARDRGGKAALRIKRGDEYQTWTFSQAWGQALSAAAYLRASGVARGAPVALFADNSPEWLLAYLGIVAAGGVVVPLDAQYGEKELANLLSFAECRAAIHDETTGERLKAALAAHRSIEALPLGPESPLFAAEPLDAPDPCPAEETMAILFTSGTTGDPKGVCLSRKNVSSNIEATLRRFRLLDHDNALCLLPLHHAYALTVSALTPLAAGCAVTFCLSLRGPDIIAAARETKVTAILGVPKLFEAFDRALAEQTRRMPRLRRAAFSILLKLSRSARRLTGWNVGRLLFPAVRKRFGGGFRLLFASGGAKLDAAITARFLDLGVPLLEGYGLTETAPILTFNPLEKPKPGSAGVALDNVEIRIDRSIAKGGGESGEVLARGPNVMLGYLKRREETDAAFRDGWFRTGDLGYLDREGYLFITGRAKEVIVLASGKNIYPEEVEKHYQQSPLVKELCVLPDEDAEGRVAHLAAVVVPDMDELRRRGAVDTHAAVRASFQDLARELPSHMRLNQLKLVSNELPRTRLGKLKRAAVRQMAFDEVARGAARQLTPEEEALLDAPGARLLIDRIRELSGRDGPILPGDHLELDLGLDSLGRIELDAILGRELGVEIPAEEAPGIATVGDLLARLSGGAGAAVKRRGWGELLSARASPLLSELFDLERRRPFARAMIHAVRHLAMFLLRRTMPADVRGAERLPAGRPFLLCPTHSSFIDAPLVFASLPSAVQDKMFFLAAEENFKSFIMRRFAKLGRVILLASAETLLPALRRTAEAVALGRSVCIFPEGGISRDGLLQRPRLGAGIIACHTGAPVVPALVRGTYEIMSHTHKGFRFRPVGVTYGEPIAAPVKERYGNEDYVSIMEDWARAVARLRAEDDDSGGRTAGRSPRIPDEWKSPRT